MKLLVDMNLSPRWCQALYRHGWETVHWSAIGDPRAPDPELMQWAAANGYVLFTHDLDFGAILAATQATSPSVVQIRMRDPLPDRREAYVASILKQFGATLEAGAIIVVDAARAGASASFGLISWPLPPPPPDTHPKSPLPGPFPLP